jgi:hypothetical protein
MENPEVFKISRHGKTYSFSLVSPSEVVFDRFMDMNRPGASESSAKLWLVKRCVVAPTGEELDKIFSEIPMFKHTIAAKLIGMAGGDSQIEEGK